ncbi:MAG: hypothetical protein AAB802_05415, partial [Patescibacteria group bacterium]
EDGPNKMVLFISFLGLAYFANMMYRCARHNESISFLRHHMVFVGGLLAMSTQMPHEIAHGLQESLIAFGAVMGITRVSRGLVSKGVDFDTVSDEEAKALIFTLGWAGSLVNSLSTSTALAPLANRLDRNEDRYIAMQNIGNIDGGIGLGAFQGLVAVNKLGLTQGPLFQAGLMIPVMLAQKLTQAVLWRPNLIKHAPLILRAVRGMRYDVKELGSTYTEKHEEHMLHEIVDELKADLARIRGELGDDYTVILDIIDEGQKEISQAFIDDIERERAEGGPGMDEAKMNGVEQYQAKTELAKELEDYLHGPEGRTDAAAVTEVVLAAMRDGQVTKEEILATKSAADLDALIKGKAPKNLIDQVTVGYERFLDRIAASHNEREIMRVFTVQAMAVPLLIPAVETMLHAAPALTEVFTAMTTAFADNYAAAAMTWGVDSAKALAVAIALGGATIYGNMPNLNFLGKNANLMDSIKASRYLLPVVGFLALYLNMGWSGKSAAQHSAEFAQSIPELISGFGDKSKEVGEGNE